MLNTSLWSNLSEFFKFNYHKIYVSYIKRCIYVSYIKDVYSICMLKATFLETYVKPQISQNKICIKLNDYFSHYKNANKIEPKIWIGHFQLK